MRKLTKSEMAELVAQGRFIESFQHQYWGHFNISAMRQGLLDGTMPFTRHEVAISDGIKETIKTLRDVEQNRVTILNLMGKLDEPVIFIHDPSDDTYDFIDGTHRIAGKIMRGEKTIKVFLIELKDAIFMGDETRTISDYGQPDFLTKAR